MTARIVGPRDWRMTRNQDGHREYKLKHVVEVDPGDGPMTALSVPGLPLAGAPWDFGDDSDPWAFCEQTADVTPTLTNEPNTQFIVEQTFSTRSPNRCQDATIEDPLLEPAKISGGGTNRSVEATHSRFGIPILTSSFEQIRGPQNEWEEGLGVVKIEQNIATAYLGYVLPTLFQNCVNALPLWGYRARCIKLSPPQWDQKYHGQCSIYYKRNLEFCINPATWDRDLLDEGSKALNGEFNRDGDYVLKRVAGEYPSRWRPQDFVRFTDRNGNQTRVVLNGAGLPAGVRVVGHVALIPTIDTTLSGSALGEAGTLSSGASQSIGMLTFQLTQFNGQTGQGGAAQTAAQAAAVLGLAYVAAARRAHASPDDEDLALAAKDIAFTFNAAVETAKDETVLLSSSGLFPAFQATADNMALLAARAVSASLAAYEASYSAWQEVVSAVNLGGTGTGTSSTSDLTTPGYRHVEKYHEVDFLLLGIPTQF